MRLAIERYEQIVEKDAEVDELLKCGTEYMLRHNMYQRLTDNSPISAHITNIMMPQSDAVSFTDFVCILGKTHLKNNPRSKQLFKLVQKKQVAHNQWNIDDTYAYKGYNGFETR